jgi:hypothetical protein
MLRVLPATLFTVSQVVDNSFPLQMRRQRTAASWAARLAAAGPLVSNRHLSRFRGGLHVTPRAGLLLALSTPPQTTLIAIGSCSHLRPLLACNNCCNRCSVLIRRASLGAQVENDLAQDVGVVRQLLAVNRHPLDFKREALIRQGEISR